MDFISKEFSQTMENKKGDEGAIEEEKNEIENDDVSIYVLWEFLYWNY